MYRVPLAFRCVRGCGNERSENRRTFFQMRGGGKNIDCLGSSMQVTCFCVVNQKEDLIVIIECFAEVCKRRGLKVNTYKYKVMVLKEEGSVFEVHCGWETVRACFGS